MKLLQDAAKRPYTFTLQAVSDDDRKKWLTVMDGQEPQYLQTKVIRNFLVCVVKR